MKRLPAKKIQQLFLLGFIIFVVLFAMGWWLYERIYVSTDDAYVNANVVQISSRVTGTVMMLPVVDNQHVSKGQLLFSLDPAMYLALVQQNLANVANAAAKLEIARLTATRTAELVKKHAASTQEGDLALANQKSAEAEKALAAAKLAAAELNLQYTKITAPDSGWVTRLSLRIGDQVNANQPLFVLVSDSEFWVDANFRETELVSIRPGQPADISIDMYPGHHFKGYVQSISSGSGAAFSLLPPENATGNWVKVTQRVPVRVLITSVFDPGFPLRIGTSASVKLRRR